MPRIRTIKPEFFRDEDLQDMQAQHPELHPMLVFAGLWTLSDKEGRFEWKPRTLHLDILPFLDFDFDASLMLLERFSMVRRYESGGKQYGLVRNFTQHQRINGKEAQDPPKYPEPVCFLEVTESTSRGSTGEALGKQSGSQEREREREKEMEKETLLSNQGDSTLFPASQEKKKTPREQVLDEVWNAYLEVFDRRGRYDFNPKRCGSGLRCLKHAERLCNGSLDNAKEMMLDRIRAVHASPFHMGQNNRNTKYVEWAEHVFHLGKFEAWAQSEIDKIRGAR